MVLEPCAKVRDLDILGRQFARRPRERHLAELVMMSVGLPVADDRYQLVGTTRRKGSSNSVHE